MKTSRRILAALVSFSPASTPVFAGPAPGDLSGLRYQSLERVNEQMNSRGFTDGGGYQQGEKPFTTWWNERTRQCVQAVTRDGRIRRFESLSEGNCT
ncbi:hypothetical protein [Accumulibacter sp.]|uniref:hypothetical protein n=1 Tax=Accumulibacter sp. TaxID=2053492 RepID=UPI0025ECF4E4|nr:hypothetical protein [Accumulibacter sp.]MCM8613110.1 hypothetical protein [Accumulibacter sp.]MCM8637084.1 hypothetical protein [Accumulibacter sp.]MCM8640126.1 hypothetical protein [Accumulibacter sp.]